MVSREPLPGRAPASEGSQEKAMTVRSVLLNRDSPDIESRLKRRRNRTQQVRFKDLVEAGMGRAASPPPRPAAAPGPNTPRASPPPRDAPELVALSASRQSWPQAQPGSLTLPMPRKACMSTAIQTSPSLQKPFPASQPRSKSVCDVAGDTVLPSTTGNTRCPGEAVPTVASWAVPPRVSGSLPMHDRATAPAQHAMVCHVPPPRDPCPPYPDTAGCPAAHCTPTAQSCAPEPCPLPPACARLRGNPRGSRGAAPRPASMPCGQPQPPAETQGLGRSDSEWSLLRGRPLPQPSPHHQQTIPTMDTHGLRQPAQGNPPWDPAPPQHQLCGTPWGGPCCTSPAPVPPALGWHSSATAAPEKTPAVLGCPDPHGIYSRLYAAEPGHGQAGPEGPREPLPPAPQGTRAGTQPVGWAPEVPQHEQPCLTAEHSETLRHIQDLLQLVVVAKGPAGPPAGDEDTRTSQGEGPRGPGEQGDLQSQLQSLEGVLETSQQTIRVLLDVIQDLEKKEAQRDGRHSYRTGQDIANCGTCRDCACIIYSVEHDFRQQEGRFQQVLSHIEGDTTPSSPATAAGTVLPPRQEPSPVTKLPVKLDTKKSRRKCFWFL
ncbi:nascent polypeptide-associated complex subunit alpha, muscle-specific form-like [Falco peregrinus]|uniref:nascent polypeptide-associated complex subunit alpha, muscle-specific form-like n=1 Tax=Falco peregrinus TaxID=8954 RepID=UPI002478B2F6|nr:nascent polypeptide-associated complex subunit alpha, muscle-specific form-like [Falco peregrinus]XP_055653425.1 nascent polypeptide-associated complex subunit alpha, muscle-specific form-like [Falco peregrinus]